MTPEPGAQLRVNTHLHKLDGVRVTFVGVSEFWGWWIVEHGGEEYAFYPGELVAE